MTERKNKNRGYQQLRVWKDAIELYRLVYSHFTGVPFELGKTASNMIAGADSVHRNIAEGYCRRSLNEYLYFLNVALGSLGETVSALRACHATGQLPDGDFQELDALTFRLENGLLRLVESLERKKTGGDWEESLVVRESNEVYGSQYSNTPSFHHSTPPPQPSPPNQPAPPLP